MSAIETKPARLTDREREVILLAMEGLVSKQIAKQLGCATRTVETHKRNLIRKFDASGMNQVIARYLTREPRIDY